MATVISQTHGRLVPLLTSKPYQHHSRTSIKEHTAEFFAHPFLLPKHLDTQKPCHISTGSHYSSITNAYFCPCPLTIFFDTSCSVQEAASQRDLQLRNLGPASAGFHFADCQRAILGRLQLCGRACGSPSRKTGCQPRQSCAGHTTLLLPI